MADWSEFTQKGARSIAEVDGTDAVAEMVMRAVSGGDGYNLLQYLRSITIERRSPEAASEAIIRELEAKRNLVHHIEHLAERGRQIAENRSGQRK